jgi:plastocyanin
MRTFPGPRSRRTLGPLALGLLLAWFLPPAAAQEAESGNVRGRVRLEVDGIKIAEAGPMVAYLEPLGGGPAPRPPATVPKVYQKDARFSPQFLAIAAGQSVAMPNDDAIYHNVFSYSTPNDFDLGLYPAGESRSVTFRHAGVVRTYCSIHESMSGTIFVAPTRYFAVLRPSGDFEIRDVAPGRYKLTTWCERLPSISREIQVQPGRGASVDLVISSATR